MLFLKKYVVEELIPKEIIDIVVIIKYIIVIVHTFSLVPHSPRLQLAVNILHALAAIASSCSSSSPWLIRFANWGWSGRALNVARSALLRLGGVRSVLLWLMVMMMLLRLLRLRLPSPSCLGQNASCQPPWVFACCNLSAFASCV